MTSHELARQLLTGPDLPVIISTGSCEDELELVDCVHEPVIQRFWNKNATGRCNELVIRLS